jgi:hypothetical protein
MTSIKNVERDGTIRLIDDSGLGAESGNYTMRPLALAREEAGTGAYIDTEGPRIENKLERACGTNGYTAICP